MFSLNDILGFYGVAIDLLAGVIVGAKSGALERNTGKQTPGTRVTEDLSSHLTAGVCGNVRTYWATGDRGVCPQFDLAAEVGAHASVIHNQQDEISSFSTDLEADTAAFDCVHRRSAPWSTELFARPANHCATPILDADDKRRLHYGWKHNDAFGLFERVIGNIVRDVEHFSQEDNTFFEVFLLSI
jgi:hypothetical protein